MMIRVTGSGSESVEFRSFEVDPVSGAVTKDSHQIALEWEARNPERVKELNDALDACSELIQMRDLFAALSQEEQNGIMPEYVRRRADEECPLGSGVKFKRDQTFVKVNDSGDWDAVESPATKMFWAPCRPPATVICQLEHGSHRRYLFLAQPVLTPLGIKSFVEVDYDSIEEL